MTSVQRYKIIVEYFGTKYYGWSSLPDAKSSNTVKTPTIQRTLENAFGRLCYYSPRPYVCGSSRTDRGVHALRQVAHVDLSFVSKCGTSQPPMQPSQLMQKVNAILIEDDIRVVGCEFAPSDWHARFQAVERTYMYQVISNCALESEKVHLQKNHRVIVRDPVCKLEHLAWSIPNKLYPEKMSEIIEFLNANRDWSTFHATGSYPTHPIRKVSIRCDSQKPSVFVTASYPEAEMFTFFFTSTSFLYRQIRNLMGFICQVGAGAIEVPAARKIVESKNRKMCPPPAPAQGLTLLDVKYPHQVIKPTHL